MEDLDWDFMLGFASCFFIGGTDAWKEWVDSRKGLGRDRLSLFCTIGL
jgi:hypothetical protein